MLQSTLCHMEQQSLLAYAIGQANYKYVEKKK